MSKNETPKPLVMRCMVMRLDEKEALDYIQEQGYDISRAQYYRIKKNIHDTRFERLSEIARGFIDHEVRCLDIIECVHTINVI